MTARWTDEEISYIHKLYPDYGAVWEYWSVYLPRRTPATIRTKASHLGVKYRGTHGQRSAKEREEAWQLPEAPLPFTVDESKEIIRSLLDLKKRLGRDPLDILDHAHDLCIQHLRDQFHDQERTDQ